MRSETAVARKLCDLSIDLLEPISAHLHHLDVANLFFVGCKILNAKLMKGGVTQLAVRWWSKSVRFTLPFIFAQMTRLTRLTLANSCEGTTILATPEILSLLPSTLKFLHLDWAGAFSSLQSLLARNPGTFPALESLSIHVGHNNTVSEDVVPLWPQSLLSLTLDVCLARRFVLHVSSLPKTLTLLDGNFLDLKSGQDEAFAAFPESLTSLRLKLRAMSVDLVPMLPAGLKSIDVWFVGGFEGTWSDTESEERSAWARAALAALPRGLTKLNWPMQVLPKESIQSLPPKLEILEAGSVLVEDWPLLPPSLTYCSAFIWSSNPAGKVTLQQIPKALTQVAVTASAVPHVKSNAKSGISVSIVGPIDGLKAEMAALQVDRMPSCITNVIRHDFLLKDALEILPTNLTCLSLGKDFVTAEQYCALPRTLKKLSLKEGALLQVLKLSENAPKLEELNLLNMTAPTWIPTTVKHLRIGRCAEFTLTWLQALPRGLCTLSIPLRSSVIPSTSATILLPVTLKKIDFRMDQAGDDEEQATTCMRNVFVALPKNLEAFRLSLRTYTSPRVTLPLSLLPKRLTELEIPKSVSFSEQ